MPETRYILELVLVGVNVAWKLRITGTVNFFQCCILVMDYHWSAAILEPPVNLFLMHWWIVGYLMMLYQLQQLHTTEWCEWMIIFSELGRIVEEVFVAYLKALYQHSPEGTGKIIKKLVGKTIYLCLFHWHQSVDKETTEYFVKKTESKSNVM